VHDLRQREWTERGRARCRGIGTTIRRRRRARNARRGQILRAAGHTTGFGVFCTVYYGMLALLALRVLQRRWAAHVG
jgi:hypothetical protein